MKEKLEMSSITQREIISTLLTALEKLADVAETALSSDPDMPSHNMSLDDFDAELDHARSVIARFSIVD